MTDRPKPDVNDADERFGVAHFAMLGGALAAPVVVGLVVLAFHAGLSPFGVMLALAVLGMWLGLLSLRSRKRARRRRGVTRASLAFFAVTLLLHALASKDNPRARLLTFPTSESSSLRAFAGALVPERDPAVLAAAFLERMQALPRVERTGMVTTLSDGYARMLADIGFAPTPATLTWLGAQSPEAYDVLEMPAEHPERGPRPLAILLHGSAGNFTLECWAFATAARKAGFATWCPSMTIDANWAGPSGSRTLDVTLREAEAAGYSRIVVAGLSSGARGLSFLAPKLADDVDVAGFILISGAARTERAPRAKPTLVLHGIHDALTPVGAARAYASERGSGVGVDVELVELVEYDANHFVMLSQQSRVSADIERFLRKVSAR